jgi:hypothetical protein
VLVTLVTKKHALVMRLSAADLAVESMRSLSDLVLATLVAKKKLSSSGDLVLATLVAKSMRSTCDLVLRPWCRKHALILRLRTGDLGGEKHALVKPT